MFSKSRDERERFERADRAKEWFVAGSGEFTFNGVRCRYEDHVKGTSQPASHLIYAYYLESDMRYSDKEIFEEKATKFLERELGYAYMSVVWGIM